MNTRKSIVPLLLSLLSSSACYGVETRTYSFVEDTRAFGWIGWGGHVSSKVEGTFEVALDFDEGVGTLLSLDAHLIDFVGSAGQPITWWRDDFFDGFEHEFADHLRPPFGGILEPAAYRPSLSDGGDDLSIIRSYIRAEYMNSSGPISRYESDGVFAAAPADSWVLYFYHLLPIESESPINLPPFAIYFENDEANFSIALPVVDDTPWIAGARAVMIPEPVQMSTILVAMCWAIALRRKFQK